MIQVQNLVKQYGQVTALDRVSFEVPSGQVLGFLGPNGAGKTTTMKILTGFLYPTSGEVTIDGLDVLESSLEVRRRVGYLPENNPLYGDMRVDDYLRFVAEIRGIPKSQTEGALDKVTHTCGLGGVIKKSIIELSKGYRQRVGLAQAMIHEPEILILDEPTSGLDPNQIVEIRDLIRSLGVDRTVILSTHYLQEVEATCDNIMIVARGRLVAEGTAPELIARMPAGPICAQFVGDPDGIRHQLGEAFHGAQIDRVPMPGDEENGLASFRIHVRQEVDRDAREAIFDLAKGNGWKLLELEREQATLEDVFRKFTTSETPVPVGSEVVAA